ncbi:MAG TPA: hypothetical protein VGP19_09645 [Candidatus Acidoferrales bacterium]|nr:hypothetical protein [Candidatus Acidoferrales bacterium]
MKHKIQVLEFNNSMKALREFVEQLAEIAVLHDRFGHFQQRLMLGFRRGTGQFASGTIVHSPENNTLVRRGSTLAAEELLTPGPQVSLPVLWQGLLDLGGLRRATRNCRNPSPSGVMNVSEMNCSGRLGACV